MSRANDRLVRRFAALRSRLDEARAASDAARRELLSAQGDYAVFLREAMGEQFSGKLDALTRREYQVLVLVREKLKNREIAERIGRSVKTVRFHVSNILSKMGVADRHRL